MSTFEHSWRRRLDAIDSAGQRRRPRHSRPLAGGRIDLGAGPLVDFASNDTLGLAQHPALIAATHALTQGYGAGAGASRLVSGNLVPYAALEAKIAAGKRAEAALILASGFQANATLLPALLDRGVHGAVPLVFTDRLNHASLIHGCLAAGVRQIRFRHNDLDHLETLLAKHPVDGQPKFIVTETVFSMEGDRADVEGLATLARRHGAFLYLDEAHATGALGEDGFGLACGLANSDCLVMGTFSKALGSFGAYAASSTVLRDFLTHRCAGLIYATALPPAVLGAIGAALDLLPRLDSERARVSAHGQRFRAAMAAAGLDTGPSSTHIVPLLLGSEQRALALAASLEEDGYHAVAIRPPTVPAGASRVRFSFSAAHSAEDVEQLIAAVLRWTKRP